MKDRRYRPYAGNPDHPLATVPEEVLAVPRTYLIAHAADLGMDPDDAEPVADAITAELAQGGYLTW